MFSMEFLDKNTIKLDITETKLDKAVLSFIKILKKHTKYVIVSGYVAILFGRSRGTEDVDVIIPEMEKLKFNLFFKELIESGYWFLNSDDPDELYGLIRSNNSIRAAKSKQMNPNFELKFAKNEIDKDSLNNSLIIKLPSGELKTSPLESQIAYKLYVLTSDKDIEDANYLLEVFKNHLDKNKLEKYSSIFKRRFK